MKFTVGEIAALVGGKVQGDPAAVITGVNGVREAKPGDICFVRGTRWMPLLDTSSAAAVLLREAPPNCPMNAIEVEDPDAAFACLLQRFGALQNHHPKGRHSSAIVGENVSLGEDVALGPHVVISDGCVIGDRVVLYAGVYIGHGCRIGADTVVYPNAVFREETEVGARCIIHANATLGTDGFGFTPVNGRWAKVPQVGKVVLGDDVEIGSGTTVDRATFGVTQIGTGTKIDNQVQVGHNVVIGEHCVIAAVTGIAGSATIGNHVRIGAQSGIKGHIEIGDGATVGARGGVTNTIPPGHIVSGFPAIDHNLERRVLVAQQRMPEMLRRMKQLERRVQELEIETA